MPETWSLQGQQIAQNVFRVSSNEYAIIAGPEYNKLEYDSSDWKVHVVHEREVREADGDKYVYNDRKGYTEYGGRQHELEPDAAYAIEQFIADVETLHFSSAVHASNFDVSAIKNRNFVMG